MRASWTLLPLSAPSPNNSLSPVGPNFIKKKNPKKETPSPLSHPQPKRKKKKGGGQGVGMFIRRCYWFLKAGKKERERERERRHY
jgi:hypothetical protein